MRKALVILVALSVVILLSAVGVWADTAPRIRANVPFAFYAGENILPAGEYVFEFRELGGYSASGSTLVIRSLDGSIFHFLPARAGESFANAAAVHVLFTKYGGSYFLSKVQHGNMQASLSKTHVERELAMAFSKGPAVASSKKAGDDSSKKPALVSAEQK